jgi:hypothetical protein
MVCIFDRACELLPPMDEGTILVYCFPSTVPSLLPPPPSPPLPMYSIYRQCVTVKGGGWGVLKCTVDHILQEIRNLQNCFTTPNKMTSEDYIKGLESLKFLRPCFESMNCRFMSHQSEAGSILCMPIGAKL